MAGSALFDIKVDTRGFDKTVAKALRDVEKVKRVALVRTANNVKRWMLEAISNNGDVVHRATGAQIVPPFKALSVLHDALHGSAPSATLSDKRSVLLRVDAAAGTAQVGWADRLAPLVGKWQSGEAGGEQRLKKPEVRHAIYRSFMRPGYTARERQFIGYLVHSPPKQPRREFVDLIAAYTAPLMAEWYEGALVSAITRRHDSYLDRLLASGDEPFAARLADARAAERKGGPRVRRRRATRQRRR